MRGLGPNGPLFVTKWAKMGFHEGGCLFVSLTGRPCGTRLGPGGPDSSQAKKPISMLALK